MNDNPHIQDDTKGCRNYCPFFTLRTKLGRINGIKTFEKILIMQCYGGEDTFTIKEVKKAIKEWLTQKRQEITEKPIGLQPKRPQLDFINELLEELGGVSE